MYKVQWMAETCHHNHGSCSASYRQDEGETEHATRAEAFAEFEKQSEYFNVYAVYMINPAGTTVKRQENF